MERNTKVARFGSMMLLALLLGTLFVLIPEEAEVDAVGAPAITVRITPESQTALVAPGQQGVVIFTGEVTALIPWSPRVQYLIVYLTYDAMGWATSGTPQLIFTRAQDTMPFSCTVQVPPMTSHQATGTLSVNVQWGYNPGIGGGTLPSPTQAIILVEQYYLMSVGCDKPYVQISPGQSIGFKMRLINDGNDLDRFRMEITNQKDLIDDDWTVQLSQNEFTVPSMQERIVTVSITTPIKTIIWKNDVEQIQIKVASSQADSLGKPSYPADYTLFVRQRGAQIPGFEPTIILIALALISAVAYSSYRKRA